MIGGAMSTEYGKVIDALDKDQSIEVATGTGGIRIFSTVNKIWLTPEGTEELVDLLRTAYFAYTGESLK